jgi:hypothetical protein
MGLSRPHRQGLSLLLAFSVLFNGLWVGGSVRAETGGDTSAVLSEARKFDELLRNSERMSPGQPRRSFALDRFLLLEQEVHRRSYVGRDFSIALNANERELEEHSARIQILRALLGHVQSYIKRTSGDHNQTGDHPCSLFTDQPSFSRQEVRKAALEHVDQGRAKDIPLFVWNAKDNPSQLICLESRLAEMLGGWVERHAELEKAKESLPQIPNFTEAPEKFLMRYYNWWDLSVALIDRRGHPVHHFQLRTTADLRAVDERNSYACDENCTVELKFGTETLHTFHLPVRAITSFGPYLVFTHEDSYDQDAGVQNLSFLDLASFGPSLGHAEIPVFRLPLTLSEPANAKRLAVIDRRLVLDSHCSVPIETFMVASELQQIAFNLLANTVDPERIREVLPYLESLHLVFEKVMNTLIQDAADEREQSRRAVVRIKELGRQLEDHVRKSPALSQILRAAEGPIEPADPNAAGHELRELLYTFGQGVRSSREMQERIGKIAERLTASRALRGRLEIFFRALFSPRPNASLKIRRALVMTGIYRDPGQKRFWDFIVDHPWLQGTILVTTVVAATSPSPFIDLASAGLAFGNGTFDYFKFSLLGLTEAIGKGTSATLAPLTDLGASFIKQYVADGNLSKTLIGLAAYVPFLLSCYYVPHLIFNLHKIYIEKRAPEWPGLVERQKQFIHEYYQQLADDEAKRRRFEREREDSARVMFSDEEQEEIRQFIEMRKSQSPAYRPPGRIGRLWMRAREEAARLTEAVTRSKVVTEDGADTEKIKGLWSALVSVVFSYPAMGLTLSHCARIWNWFAGVRYSSISFLTARDLGLKYEIPVFIRPKPMTLAVRLLYPDFFNTTVAKRGPKLTVPTELNGGLRAWGARDAVWLKESLFGKSSERRAVEEDIEREWTLSELKAASEAFESGILDVEDAIFRAAFETAIGRLADFISENDQTVALFKDRPLKSAFERRVRELPAQIRTFIRLYTEEIYGRTMHDYLHGEIQRMEEGSGEIQVSSRTLAQLKAHLVRFRKTASGTERFEPDQALTLARAHLHDEALFQSIARQARRGEWSLHNWLVNRKYNVIGDFDPEQNESMARFAVVQERLKSPNALDRAVRSEFSKLLVTMPLDLAFKLFLSAGILEGAFKPIQNVFWGTNSVAYFSRDSMYMGMASGFVMSMFADGWVKILEDARQDDLGGFGTIPKGQDASSFFRWFRKQFADRSNSLLANWSYANTLVFWNLPSALVVTGVFQYLFAGRVDLSLIFAGYVVAFATPLAAFYYKVDQAFERAVDFAARDIPDERWLAHPDVQRLINKEKQYYRNRFQFLTDIYTNVQINWLHNVEVIPTGLGTRGFVRSILHGYMMEELIVNKLLNPVRSVGTGIPVLGKVIDAISGACEHLLTNGNTDLWKKD